MAVDNNPIYQYLKSEGVTDLNEVDFINKYTDRNNLRPVYDWLKSNENTDLEFEAFADKYFPLPKLNEGSSQGSENTSVTSTELSQPSQSTSYGGLGSQPLGETRFDLGVNDINFEVAPQLPTQVLGENGEILNVEIGQAEIVPTDKKTYLQSLENSLNNNLNQFKGIDERIQITGGALAKKILGQTNTDALADFLGFDYNVAMDNAYQELDRLGGKMLETGNLTDGEIASGATDAVLSLVYTGLISGATAGVGLFTDMVGGSIADYNQTKADNLGISVEELYKQNKEDVIAPAIIGGLGFALERIGLKGVKSAMTRQLSSGLGRNLAVIGLDINKEGTTELVQYGLDGVNEHLANGGNMTDVAEVFASRIASKEGLEQYLKGLVASGVIATPNIAVSTISNSKERQQALSLDTERRALIEQLNNEAVTSNPIAREAVLNKIESLTNDINTIVDKDFNDNKQDLPIEQVEQVSTLADMVTEIEQQIESENTPEEVKSALRDEQTRLQTAIDEIISSSNNTQNQESVDTTTDLPIHKDKLVYSGGENNASEGRSGVRYYTSNRDYANLYETGTENRSNKQQYQQEAEEFYNENYAEKPDESKIGQEVKGEVLAEVYEGEEATYVLEDFINPQLQGLGLPTFDTYQSAVDFYNKNKGSRDKGVTPILSILSMDLFKDIPSESVVYSQEMYDRDLGKYNKWKNEGEAEYNNLKDKYENYLKPSYLRGNGLSLNVDFSKDTPETIFQKLKSLGITDEFKGGNFLDNYESDLKDFAKKNNIQFYDGIKGGVSGSLNSTISDEVIVVDNAGAILVSEYGKNREKSKTNNNETETEVPSNTVVTDTESTQSPTELEVEGEVVTPTQQRLQEIQTKREEIRQRIRTKYGTLNTGINPEQIRDYVELGATYVEEGVVRFSDFVTRLQEDFKDNPKLFDKLKDKDLREVFRQSVEANGLKVRGFVNTALDSPKVSDTTKTILEQTSDELTYTPQVYSEIEERMAQTSEAEKLTKIGQLSRITGELRDSDNDAIIAGISLINQYEAEGRYDESAKVMEEMAKSATVIAQALRQYGEFKNSTPKGYIQLVETMLKEKGKELNPTNRTKIEQLFKEFQKATENFQKESENISNDLSKEARKKYLDAEVELENANRAVSDYVGRIYGKNTGDLLSQIVQGNLLTLKSLIINPFSNTIQASVRASQNSVAWLLDQVFTLSIGQGSKIAPWDVDAIRLGTRGVKEGTQKAYRKAVYGDASTELSKYDINKRLKPFTAMSDLIKTLTSEDFRQEFPQTTEDILNNLAESTLGVPANLMFRMLPFGDDPFFQQAKVEKLVEIGKKNRKLSGEALEKFVNKPDEKSNAEAVEYAKSATFQDATKLAQFIRGIMNSVEDVISSKTTGVPYIGKTLDATTKVVLKSLIPFVGTPSSILQKTIRFAVPLIPTIEFGYNLSQYAKVVKRKGVNHEDAINWQRKIVESGAEVAISGAVISVAMTLVSLGLASGDAPDEQERAKERNFMFQTMPPNHLNVTGLKRAMAGGDPTYQKGDVTVSYMPLGLLGAQIGIVESTMGAKLREDVKKSKVLTTEGNPFYDLDKSKGLLNYMVNITDNVPASLKYFMSQSIVQSSNTLLEAVATGEYDQFGNQMVRTLGSLGVPNQVSQYFRATNDYMRDIYTEEDLQTWGNIIKEKTANVEDLPIRYNMWGEPVTQSPKGENPYVYQMLDIFRSQKILEDELTYKVFDLFKKTQNTTVIPTSARDFFNEGDFTVKLNKEQKSELTRLVGERRRILAEKVMRSYTKDVEKPERYVERLKKAYSNGAKQGKALFMKQLRDQGVNIRANINLQTQDKQVELETNE